MKQEIAQGPRRPKRNFAPSPFDDTAIRVRHRQQRGIIDYRLKFRLSQYLPIAHFRQCGEEVGSIHKLVAANMSRFWPTETDNVVSAIAQERNPSWFETPLKSRDVKVRSHVR